MTTTRLPMMPLQVDNYYRNYRVSKVQKGDSVTYRIRAMGDATLLHEASTPEEARKVIDDWHNAR